MGRAPLIYFIYIMCVVHVVTFNIYLFITDFDCMHLYLNSILKVKLSQSPVPQFPLPQFPVPQCPEACIYEWLGTATVLLEPPKRQTCMNCTFVQQTGNWALHTCLLLQQFMWHTTVPVHVYTCTLCLWKVLFFAGFKSVVCARTSCPYGTISLSLLYRETITLPDR